MIQCHGSFASASCIKCRYQVEGPAIFDDVKAGKVPRCSRCMTENGSSNGGKKRKRGAGQNEGKRKRSSDDSADDDDDDGYDIPEPGVMKVCFDLIASYTAFACPKLSLSIPLS